MIRWLLWLFGALPPGFVYSPCEKLMLSIIDPHLDEDSEITKEISLRSLITKEDNEDGDLCW